jgi:hypothetical protein
MAVITVSILGGNWNAVTTWVGGVVPSPTLDTVAFTATSGNLTVNVASTCIGIDFTNYVNTITFTALLTINGPVNLGTGGYTQAGASGIQVAGTFTITSGGVTWSRLWTFSGGGIFTLADNWNFTGTLNFSNTGGLNINGNTINTSNLTSTSGSAVSGTTNIVFNGTGTWSNTSTGAVRNNITINTTGTLTISGNVYYNTGTLTYTAGTVDTSGSTLNIALATTLNTSGMTWNNVTITSGIQTLTSDLNCQNLTNSTVTINGLFNINVSGNLTANGITQGTSTIVLMGTGLWTASNSSNTFRTPIIINTNGIITLANSLTHDGDLTYIKGIVKSNNTTISFGSTIKTLINLHKIIFKNVIFDSGITTTMNEFFSGSPSLVTNISSSSTTANYTIAFQDGFEKIAKFVNISNCTLSKPLQLLVITKSKRNSRNSGIRYINQSPNGIAKGEPSVNQTTFGAGGLLPDPIKL